MAAVHLRNCISEMECVSGQVSWEMNYEMWEVYQGVNAGSTPWGARQAGLVRVSSWVVMWLPRSLSQGQLGMTLQGGPSLLIRGQDFGPFII